jgi:hypothetical protein
MRRNFVKTETDGQVCLLMTHIKQNCLRSKKKEEEEGKGEESKGCILLRSHK